jgi:hypothetical protein
MYGQEFQAERIVRVVEETAPVEEDEEGAESG